MDAFFLGLLLEAITKIDDDSQCSRMLREVAKYLPEDLLPTALEITRQIDDEFSRSRTLRELIKYLPKKLFSEALWIVKSINDEDSRANALCWAARYLSEELLTESLAIMWQVQDPYFRSQALSGLLPHLMKLGITFDDWTAMLEVLAYQNRNALLQELPDISPIILELGDEQAFSDILQVVRDVCAQWP